MHLFSFKSDLCCIAGYLYSFALNCGQCSGKKEIWKDGNVFGNEYEILRRTNTYQKQPSLRSRSERLVSLKDGGLQFLNI